MDAKIHSVSSIDSMSICLVFAVEKSVLDKFSSLVFLHLKIIAFRSLRYSL